MSDVVKGVRPPPWVTRELLEETRQVWESRWKGTITDKDALEIILSVGRLLDTLSVLKHTV